MFVDKVADAIVETIEKRISGVELINHYEEEIRFLRGMLEAERKSAEKFRADSLFYRQQYLKEVEEKLKGGSKNGSCK